MSIYLANETGIRFCSVAIGQGVAITFKFVQIWCEVHSEMNKVNPWRKKSCRYIELQHPTFAAQSNTLKHIFLTELKKWMSHRLESSMEF